jgi:hypothetical protein
MPDKERLQEIIKEITTEFETKYGSRTVHQTGINKFLLDKIVENKLEIEELKKEIKDEKNKEKK